MDLALKRKFLQWFEQNHRPLPWRKTQDPYAIWISEVMLQQTTSQAVIPYYDKFLALFPTVKDLATASEGEVLQAWAGLGYYSRARNLHKAAKAIAAMGDFPQTAAELLALPGFGPYTSRAVSSIAFEERVGVLDGNVIRVLSRFHSLKTKWWTTAGRKQFQDLADSAVESVSSKAMNQALMELGHSICLPQNPKCLLCPLMKVCKSKLQQNQKNLPLKKPKKQKEYWVWQPQVIRRKNQLLLVKNESISFLKGHWILPGVAKQVDKRPVHFDYKHTITHHEIYVQRREKPVKLGTRKKQEQQWIDISNLQKISPTSLVLKAIKL